MSRPQRTPDPDSLIAHFGSELRVHRAKADLSQNRLAEALGCTGQWIGQVELGEKSPSEQFAIDLDTYFKTDESFHRLWKSIKSAVRRLAIPHWFIEWVEIEQKADAIRSWEPLVIPGLLQTPDYAHTVLSRQPGITADEVEAQTSRRLERQGILTRENPPLLWTLIDEAVLHRPIGDTRIMRDQLAHLREMSIRSNVSIQVVPLDAGGSCGLAGAFWIASIPDQPDAVYFESARGSVTDHPGTVAEVRNNYAAIRADALPARASTELIVKVMEERWA